LTVHEAVSDILVDRAREADGLPQMLVLSGFVHATLIAVLIVIPASWRSASVSPDVTPMTITLGGGSGPDAGGMTPIAGRAVQVEAPPEARPPAPTPPEMVEPAPVAKPVAKTPAKPIEKPADKSAARKPTSGPEVKTGDARANTGAAPIPFGGLTRPSGGGAPNQGAFTDYADFCCPAYLNQMTDLIKRNWDPNQGAAGQVQVKFTIRRDGTLTGPPQVEKSSNQTFLDLESQRAIVKVGQFPGLPREFTENTLTVHLVFEYNR
jgi:TonB family protein